MLSTFSSSPYVRSPSISGNLSPPPLSAVRFRPPAVAQSAPSTCPYFVLGIPTGASGDEIKAAYRRLARLRHPDVATDSTAEEFVRINAAYSTLSDPERRADYDRRRLRSRSCGGAVVSDSPATGLSGCTCRNWETDQCW